MTGRAENGDLESLAISLLLEAVHQHNGVDLRPFARAALRSSVIAIKREDNRPIG